MHMGRGRSMSFVGHLGTSDRGRLHIKGIFVTSVHSFTSVHHGFRRDSVDRLHGCISNVIFLLLGVFLKLLNAF